MSSVGNPKPLQNKIFFIKKIYWRPFCIVWKLVLSSDNVNIAENGSVIYSNNLKSFITLIHSRGDVTYSVSIQHI